MLVDVRGSDVSPTSAATGGTLVAAPAITGLAQPHVRELASRAGEAGRDAGERLPTTGEPVIVVTPVGQRRLGDAVAGADRDRPRRRRDVARLVLDVDRQRLRLADVGRRRSSASGTGTRPSLHELALHAQADLLEVAALVDGLDLDLDRVGGADRRALAGRSQVTVGAVGVGVVGSR